jgi:peptide subunit release factor 1 (eRF1)
MTTATADMTTCDGCEAEMTEALYDASEGLCDACMRLRFTCSECEELTLKTDAHATHKTMCESCGESKAEEERQEALDKAAEELRDLVEEVIGGEDLAVIKKALAALKRAAK